MFIDPPCFFLSLLLPQAELRAENASLGQQVTALTRFNDRQSAKLSDTFAQLKQKTLATYKTAAEAHDIARGAASRVVEVIWRTRYIRVSPETYSRPPNGARWSIQSACPTSTQNYRRIVQG